MVNESSNLGYSDFKLDWRFHLIGLHLAVYEYSKEFEDTIVELRDSKDSQNLDLAIAMLENIDDKKRKEEWKLE